MARATCCPGREAQAERQEAKGPYRTDHNRRPPGGGPQSVAAAVLSGGCFLPHGYFAEATSSATPSGSTPSQSLPRARVIRRRTVFDATRTKGRRLGNRWMGLNVLPIDPAKPDAAAVAFLTPKRLGPATVRTRLRRRMREIYRRRLMLPREPAYLVWVARPPAVELDFEALAKCMAELRKRAGN